MNCNGTVLQYICNYGEISGTSECGGIFGHLEIDYHPSDIVQLGNKGKVSGNSNVGGIVGYCKTILIYGRIRQSSSIVLQNMSHFTIGYKHSVK